MGQLQMFGMNIFLLIGLLLFGLITFILLIVFWTTIKVYFFQRQQRTNPYKKFGWKTVAPVEGMPPSSAGICDTCGRVLSAVFHLPGGVRQCSTCYRKASVTKQNSASMTAPAATENSSIDSPSRS